MTILSRRIAVYASSPPSSLSLFSVCHQYLHDFHSTVSTSTMEKPSKGGQSELDHSKETAFKGEYDLATKKRFADKIMPSILRLYGSCATARDFDIYAPFASFEDPLMCAHGVKQIKSAFYSVSKVFSESEIVEYSIEEHETSPTRREILIDNKQHYKFLGKDIEVMSLIKLYVADGKIIRHEDWWDKKPLWNRETVNFPLLGRAVEITRRASMLATHAFMRFGDIGFCPYGDYWREMRKFCVLELLSKKRLQSFQSIREQEVMSVIDFISQASLNKTPIDVSDMIFSLTAFTTCKIAFGRGFRGTKIDVGRFQDIMHEATSLLAGFSASDFFPYTGWLVDLLTGFHGRLEKIFHKFDEFYQQIIDQHVDTKRGTDEVEDVIDILLKLAEDDQADFGTLQITPNHIKAILMNLFLGGVDTTAITMTWAMAELVRNPDILKKVQHEVRACVGNRGRVTENDVEDLHYLKLIVKETLRLHPPAPLLGPRETMSAVKLNGFDIPNKTRILINAWGIGRDPSSWKSADEFIPERFQDSPIDYKGQYFQFLPFGSGRRGCAGMYMGVTMVELGLANLLYSFDWTVPNGMEDIDMEEGFGLTAHKKKPLILLPLLHHKEETDMVSN